MDEPLSNLDAKLRNEMRAHLKDLQKRLGVTTVYVTHDQLEAMTLGHRIAIMNNGVLQQVGTPVEIYRAPINQFVARFIGSPTMNMLTGSLLEESGSLYLQADSIKIKLPASTAASLKAKNLKQVTLGVRPERLYVKPQSEQNLALPISVIENIGPEFLVYSFHKQGQTVVRTPDEPTSDSLSLVLDPEHLHLFDEQGNRIAG
ncbi:MAG TPA: hypothetical protein DCG57_17460 [Candidatus Riflebacteria bacterium]|nr:hypothetical protein [Candidatus Riflebacteria bacterium]